MPNKKFEWLNEYRKEQLRRSTRNPGLAAALSAIFMGLGHIYAGHIDKGILLVGTNAVMIIVTASTYMKGALYVVLSGAIGNKLFFAIYYFLLTAYLMLWSYSVKDAYHLALFSSFRDWFELERVLLQHIGVPSDQLLIGMSAPERNMKLIEHVTADGKVIDEDGSIDVESAPSAKLVADFIKTDPGALIDDAASSSSSWKTYAVIVTVMLVLGVFIVGNYGRIEDAVTGIEPSISMDMAMSSSELPTSDALLKQEQEIIMPPSSNSSASSHLVQEIHNETLYNEHLALNETSSPTALSSDLAEKQFDREGFLKAAALAQAGDNVDVEEILAKYKNIPVIPTPAYRTESVSEESVFTSKKDAFSPLQRNIIVHQEDVPVSMPQENLFADATIAAEKPEIFIEPVKTAPEANKVIFVQGKQEPRLIEKESPEYAYATVSEEILVPSSSVSQKSLEVSVAAPVSANLSPTSDLSQFSENSLPASTTQKQLAGDDFVEGNVLYVALEPAEDFGEDSKFQTVSADELEFQEAQQQEQTSPSPEELLARQKYLETQRILEERREKGRNYFYAGDWELALQEYLFLLEHQKDYETYEMIGLLFDRLKVYDASYEAYKTAYALDSSSPHLLIRLAKLAEQSGNYIEGEKFLALAIEERPNRVDLKISYARCLAHNGKPSAAIDFLKRLYDQSSSYAVKKAIETELRAIM
ncbi:MAG: hypothetical protein GX221_08700 [Candidatus Riflebacteria bacterium]|nr:hypothetical protein [Candidatus Riflebacteria bacterium]